MRIKPNQLESLQNYDWLWEVRHYGAPQEPKICGLCHEALAEYDCEYCEPCQKAWDELDGEK